MLAPDRRLTVWARLASIFAMLSGAEWEQASSFFQAAAELGMESEAVRLASEVEGIERIAARYAAVRPAFAARLTLGFAERRLRAWRGERNPNAMNVEFRTDEVAQAINTQLAKGREWACAGGAESLWQAALSEWLETVPPGGLKDLLRLPTAADSPKQATLLAALDELLGADDIVSTPHEES